MKIDYVAQDICEPAEVVDAIRARRGGELVELDRMLLHSPNYAAGWNTFLGAVRGDLDVSSKLSELAICYVAVLNEAEYEWMQHAPIFRAVGGTQAQLDAIRDRKSTDKPINNVACFDAVESAVLNLTAEMTHGVKPAPGTMDAVIAALPNEQQVVEIVGVIAAYNMVSRFLVALEVGA